MLKVASTVRAGIQLFSCRRSVRMASGQSHEHMVWVDCEMSGLSIESDHLLEMACLVTDKNLNILAQGPNIVIHQADSILDGMDEWNTRHHGQSGLTQAVRNSHISLEAAEAQMTTFLEDHTPQGKCPLVGNSIHADRTFLVKYMPRFVAHLHYRIIDVSSIKELCRAMDDILESIEELKYYRKHFFK